MMSHDSVRRILILAANPRSSTPLRLDQEVREIDDALKGARNRDQFELKQKWAVRPKDMRRSVLEFEPHIVHFSGHGAGTGGLALEDEAGQAKLVSAEALAGMFEYAEQVECVLLNACYSEVQAVAIAQHIRYVVGMNQEVGDRAALEFAIGFYDALGAGRSVERAFKEGCISIRMAGIAEHLTPVLKCQSTGKATVVETTAQSNQKSLPQPYQPTQIDRLPSMDSLKLDEPEGQIPLDSPLYVERPPIEKRCYETIMKPGALIRIKAPRQMGKSSLMLRILNHAIQQGYRATSLDLQSAGRQVLSSLDSFLHWFCARVTRKLNLADKLEDYWKGALGSNDKCTDYFELYLLPKINGVLALCLDEVDELFKHPAIANDFFGLLRAWHEESKINPVWRNLRLVITYSKEVYVPLDVNRSPFNVGVPIDLPQLTQKQVENLVQRHGLSWVDTEIAQLMVLVGGHPYLLRMALYHIALGDISLERLQQIAPTAEWEYEGHLRRHLLNLEEDEALITAMRQVVMSDKPVRIKTAAAFKLTCMGLVRYQGNDVIPVCDLYRRYFKERLGVG
ncbi:AAA-like domain-containing protein [Phormidesmis sp. 146-12]